MTANTIKSNVQVETGQMPSRSVPTLRDWFTLGADGCLITAGTFSLMMGAAFGLEKLGVAPLGSPQTSWFMTLLSWLSWLLQIGGFVVGPVLTWLLYRRRASTRAALGAIAGFPVAGAIVMAASMLGALIDWVVGQFTSVEFAGAIAYLFLVSAAFLAMIVWLNVDAVRDLAHSHRQHLPVNIGRFAATVTVVVFMVAVIVLVSAGADPEAWVFVLAAGVVGGVVVVVADIVARFFESRTTRQGQQASDPTSTSHGRTGTAA